MKKLVRIASQDSGITHEAILRIYEERIQRLTLIEKEDEAANAGSAILGTTVGLTQDRELRRRPRVMKKLKVKKVLIFLF